MSLLRVIIIFSTDFQSSWEYEIKTYGSSLEYSFISASSLNNQILPYTNDALIVYNARILSRNVNDIQQLIIEMLLLKFIRRRALVGWFNRYRLYAVDALACESISPFSINPF